MNMIIRSGLGFLVWPVGSILIFLPILLDLGTNLDTLPGLRGAVGIWLVWTLLVGLLIAYLARRTKPPDSDLRKHLWRYVDWWLAGAFLILLLNLWWALLDFTKLDGIWVYWTLLYDPSLLVQVLTRLNEASYRFPVGLADDLIWWTGLLLIFWWYFLARELGDKAWHQLGDWLLAWVGGLVLLLRLAPAVLHALVPQADGQLDRFTSPVALVAIWTVLLFLVFLFAYEDAEVKKSEFYQLQFALYRGIWAACSVVLLVTFLTGELAYQSVRTLSEQALITQTLHDLEDSTRATHTDALALWEYVNTINVSPTPNPFTSNSLGPLPNLPTPIVTRNSQQQSPLVADLLPTSVNETVEPTTVTATASATMTPLPRWNQDKADVQERLGELLLAQWMHDATTAHDRANDALSQLNSLLTSTTIYTPLLTSLTHTQLVLTQVTAATNRMVNAVNSLSASANSLASPVGGSEANGDLTPITTTQTSMVRAKSIKFFNTLQELKEQGSTAVDEAHNAYVAAQIASRSMEGVNIVPLALFVWTGVLFTVLVLFPLGADAAIHLPQTT